ncbi:MAG: hypothetical protein PUK15_05985 [Bacteroidales bacterium]|nr:hypothetical protein [Bacteroidales bacterium]
MKKLLFSAVSVLMICFAVDSSAQGKYGKDSAECITYLSYYKEYFKQKNYDQALPNWRKAFKVCPPTANQTMLIDGTTLVRKEITRNRNNSFLKQGLIDTLMTLHDLRAEYYPKYAVTAMNNKGLDMINYLQDEPEVLYKGCNEIIAANGKQTKAQIYLFRFNSAVSLYKSGILDAEQVIDDYESTMAALEQMTSSEALEKTKADIENIFITSNVASCDNLIALFTPRFEADPENLDLVSKIVNMMSSTEGCMDNDLFLSAISKKSELDPSYKTSYILYKLYSSRNEFDAAVSSLEKAIAFEESDLATDADYYYELAAYSLKNGKYAKSVDAANKAIDLNPALAGKCYLICGTAWGSVTSNGDYIEKRAPYWVAVDYLVKAKNADESLTEECNSLISSYSKYFPETSEAFMYGVQNGQSYRVSAGGMSANTIVRTQK